MGREFEVAICDFKLRGHGERHIKLRGQGNACGAREGARGQGDMGTRAMHARGHAGKVTRGQGGRQRGRGRGRGYAGDA